MAISSSDISPARGSSSSSSSKLEQKKLKFLKKKMLGSAKKKVVTRHTPVILTSKKTSGYRKISQETIVNTRMSQKSSRSDQVEMNSPAMNLARDVQSKLPPEFPTFLKYMLKSHVTGGFWLSLPKPFCDLHLPKQDETIWLVGEHVKEYMTKYLIDKNGLSGGWRSFSMSHKLAEGDVLVFQLIESLKFKVYIMRANKTSEIDGAVGLLNLHSQAKALDIAHSEDEFEDVKNVEMISADKCLEPSDETEIDQENGICDRNADALDSEPSAALQQTENGNDELGSEEMEGIRLAKSTLEFINVKGFDSFSILVNGLVIDTEVPMHLRYKYYELCRNQKSFLHDDLVKGLNCKLAAGIISETVNIADAIKAAKLSVSLEHLQSWDKTLKAFEDMGMKVGFLRTRLNKLVCLLYEQQEVIRSKKVEQAQLEEEIKELESKLSKRFEVKKALDAEIERLMGKDLSDLEVTFKNTANAAW